MYIYTYVYMYVWIRVNSSGRHMSFDPLVKIILFYPFFHFHSVETWEKTHIETKNRLQKWAGVLFVFCVQALVEFKCKKNNSKNKIQ